MPQAKNTVSKKIEPVTQFEITALQWALGATALFSAIFYYICWVYQHRYFESFGLYPEIVGFTSPEYFLNAKSALAVNTLIIGLLISIRFVIDLESKWVRMTIAWISLAGMIGSLIYIINDIRVWWSAFGITVVAYRSVWLLSTLVLALLAYGIISPTFIYEKIHRSKNYPDLGYLAVWSSLGALALVLITLTTNLIGGLEGRHDVSANSRLGLINLTTMTPLGFNLQPDALEKDAVGNNLYVYHNLRILTEHNSVLYVFRPQNPPSSPALHMVRMSDVYASSLGWYEPAVLPVPSPTP